MKKTLAVGLPLSLAAALSMPAAIIISEIDLNNDKVEIVNTGPGSVDLTGYYLCNRLTGSPFYQALTTGLIDLTKSTHGNLLLASGNIMTLQLTASYITDATGEFGLYRNASNYGSSANIVDYVGWGADGVRDSVAAAAGIWVNASFVNATGNGPGLTLQLGFGKAGNVAADYGFAASTIGVAQSVPEPSALALCLVGGIGLAFQRSRRRS